LGCIQHFLTDCWDKRIVGEESFVVFKNFKIKGLDAPVSGKYQFNAAQACLNAHAAQAGLYALTPRKLVLPI